MNQLRKSSDSADRSVWVVLPCYNVAKHIRSVIASIPSDIAGIVAVNDASNDETLDLLRTSKAGSRLHILDNETNLGVGGSTKRGFEFAFDSGAEVVVKLDGDGQMDP